MLVSIVQQSKPVTHTLMKVKVKFTQLCPTLCDPLDYTVHGILQPSPGDLPNPGIKPRSPALQAYSLLSELLEKPEEA